MAILDVNRQYSDGEVLTEAQLDTIRTDIETFFNTTKVDDENIQNAGLTASTALADGSVSTTKFQDESVLAAKIIANAVTTAKIADNAVTSAKVAANAVTAAKLTSLFLPTEEGSIRLFHTYNDTLDIPRGWMICNGNVVNETNYEAIHGSGTYATDGIASSNLLNLYLPNYTDRYAVGATATTQDGVSATMTPVGNTDHEIDFAHTHSGASHTHGPSSTTYGTYDTINTTGLQQGDTQAATYTLQSALSDNTEIKPESVEMVFIMRVI